jgi:hypothetical protein
MTICDASANCGRRSSGNTFRRTVSVSMTSRSTDSNASESTGAQIWHVLRTPLVSDIVRGLAQVFAV